MWFAVTFVLGNVTVAQSTDIQQPKIWGHKWTRLHHEICRHSVTHLLAYA